MMPELNRIYVGDCLIASAYGRSFLGIELNPEYVAMAKRRIATETAQMKMAV